jgi:hypothetical protein
MGRRRRKKDGGREMGLGKETEEEVRKAGEGERRSRRQKEAWCCAEWGHTEVFPEGQASSLF